MPEVIEIRKFAKFLKEYMLNKKIKDIIIHKGRYKKYEPFTLYNKIVKNLPLKVLDIKTKGKFLYFILEKDFYLYSTLGLTGGWTYYNNKTKKFTFPKLIDYIPDEKMEQYKKTALNHLNIEFTIPNGKIYYYDNLSFGTMKVVDNKNNLNKKLKELAPDIMDSSTTLKFYKEQLLKNKYQDKPIGLVLMDQKFISGIGNYLRSDILWLSRVNPYTLVKNLNNKQIEKIYYNSKLLTWGDYNFKEAVKQKIIKKTDKLPKDYKRNFFVYMQKEDIYGNPIVKEPLYTGRIKRFIYYVPKLQK
jgi:formamidopyrimidine-DNA glycosylase